MVVDIVVEEPVPILLVALLPVLMLPVAVLPVPVLISVV